MSNTPIANTLSHLIPPIIFFGCFVPPWNLGWWAFGLVSGMLRDPTGMGFPYLVSLPGVMLSWPFCQVIDHIRGWEVRRAEK